MSISSQYALDKYAHSSWQTAFFNCDTSVPSGDLSMKFKLLINIKIAQINGIFRVIHRSQSFNLLIDVKLPTAF